MNFVSLHQARLSLLIAMTSAAVIEILYSAPAVAYEARLRPQFERLELQTRLEEVCDTEVMIRINKDHPEFVADKVIAYTFKQSIQKNNSITADGASFRSKEKWFRLSYKCQTGPRHLDVSSLSYQIGTEISRNQWSRLYLYD